MAEDGDAGGGLGELCGGGSAGPKPTCCSGSLKVPLSADRPGLWGRRGSSRLDFAGKLSSRKSGAVGELLFQLKTVGSRKQGQ